MRSTSCSAAAVDVRSLPAKRPNPDRMNPQRDDLAVMRFAIRSRDWRLVELMARLLGHERSDWLEVAHAAYMTLSARLEIGNDLL